MVPTSPDNRGSPGLAFLSLSVFEEQWLIKESMVEIFFDTVIDLQDPRKD